MSFLDGIVGTSLNPDIFFVIIIVLVGMVAIFLRKSGLVYIGPDEIGLVIKNFGSPLPKGQILAFNDEAGYQADVLAPGWRFKTPYFYSVEKFPVLQIPSDSVGVILSQIGKDLPAGALNATGEGLSAEDYKDPRVFISKNGEKGIQRIVLPYSSTWTLNPVAFVVRTTAGTWGKPMSESGTKGFENMHTSVTVVGGVSNLVSAEVGK
jgi:hypothetical protein